MTPKKPAIPKLDPKLLAMASVTAIIVTVMLFLFGPFTGVLGYIVSPAGGIGIGVFVYRLPKLMVGKKGSRIDDALPFFITHFGVLATSNLPRAEMLRILAENEEYKEIASEMGRVLRLTSEWGLSMADAVRAVAESTPSKIFSAFLLRLAHSLESGQQLESFLMSEQSVVMRDYTSIYTANLLKVDSWKEMYTNSIMTIGFMAVFASVIPLLVGGSTLLFTAGVAGTTLVLEILLGVALQDRLPHDRLSPVRKISTAFEQRVKKLLIVCGAISAFLAVAAFFLFGLGWAILAMMVPVAIPGIYAIREETAIRQRENDFPAFIRSLGAAAAARGGAIRQVLGSIQANNLGALTEPVRDLHRRLMWRVDDRRTWRVFGETTESRLIDSFTEMFVQGIGAGGKPGPISQIISDNMLRILALRTTRRATGSTFRSLLIGIGIGFAVVLFMGSGIFSNLTESFAAFGDELANQGLLQIETSNTELTQQLLYATMLFHGLAAGVFYKLVEGGRVEGSTLHMAIYTITGVGTGMFVLSFTPNLLNFG